MLGKFEIDLIQDDDGNAIVLQGATVEVRPESSGALAQLYASQNGDTTSPRTPGPIRSRLAHPIRKAPILL